MIKTDRFNCQLIKPVRNGHAGSLTTDWLTTFEAAEYLRISPATLRNMTYSGRIPYTKLGRSNRYSKTQLDRLLLANAKGI